MTPDVCIQSTTAFDNPRSSIREDRTSDTDSTGIRLWEHIPYPRRDSQRQYESSLKVLALEGGH
jgi:hypothetical protein